MFWGGELVVNVWGGGAGLDAGGKKEKYGREGSMPSHILNVTDEIIQFTTPSEILLVFLTRHCMDSLV
jgi:hypothetical protein